MSTPLSIAPLPADVRAAGAEGRKLYAAALGFEQVLVRSLAAQLAETAEPSDESGDAASSLVREQIPDALADGIAASGGLGLAHDLYLAMRRGGVGSTEPPRSGDAGLAGVGAGTR